MSERTGNRRSDARWSCLHRNSLSPKRRMYDIDCLEYRKGDTLDDDEFLAAYDIKEMRSGQVRQGPLEWIKLRLGDTTRVYINLGRRLEIPTLMLCFRLNRGEFHGISYNVRCDKKFSILLQDERFIDNGTIESQFGDLRWITFKDNPKITFKYDRAWEEDRNLALQKEAARNPLPVVDYFIQILRGETT